uniref:Small ribosomal subunit protein uS3m n=1 Tax=Closterium baillyanum TaxID=1416941 RepID=U5YGQ2_9VIRI|nr:ribosomal protein S3 [Closterium baillyanum]AGZ90261.1 ribosomal protein S3 [Closterium baillyanum]
MAQKVNPIAVRLRFNRSSDSSWFSDYYYSTLLYQDLNFRDYLSSIRQPNANKLGFRPGKCVIHHFPKRSLIHLFCLGTKSQPLTWPKLEVRSAAWTKRKNRQLLATVPKRKMLLLPPFVGPHVAATAPSSLFQRMEQRAVLKDPKTIVASLEILLWFQRIRAFQSQFFRNQNIRNCDGSWSSSSISQKKTAIASCYARQSYNFSKQSLNQLGDVFIESRTHELTRSGHVSLAAKQLEEPGDVTCVASGGASHLSFNKAGATIGSKEALCFAASGRKGFLANLLELHKAALAALGCSLARSTTVGLTLGRCEAVAATAMTAPKEPKHRTRKAVFSFQPVGQQWVNQILTGSGWTSFTLGAFGQAYSTHLKYTTLAKPSMRLRTTVSQSTQSKGTQSSPFSQMPRHQGHTIAAPLSRAVSTPEQEASFACKCHGTKGQASPFGRAFVPLLYFNYYAMHYFFLKKTNSLRDEKHINHAQARGATNALAPLARSRYFYLSNVQSILSDKTSTFTSLRPIKVSSIFQSASLIAQEIACKLEQKKSFRQICRSIFQQISICKYIKGIRISCSGRLNGAEIAKSSCRKYGETSLHVFSDKIDYAQTKASTPYGILGVKVWISYV